MIRLHMYLYIDVYKALLNKVEDKIEDIIK